MGDAGRYIPNELTNFRRYFNISQQEAAWRLDIPQSKLSNWENGKVMPSGDHLIDLCNLYLTVPQLLYPRQNEISKEKLARNTAQRAEKTTKKSSKK